MKIQELLIIMGIASGMAGCAETNTSFRQQIPDKQELSRYQWQLSKAINKHGQSLSDFNLPSGLQLRFDSQNLLVSGGCNAMNAAYSLNKNQLVVKNAISTRKACSSELMAKDQAFINFIEDSNIKVEMRQAEQSQDQQPRLLLQNTHGDQLIWNGNLTLETQFGQPDLVFWQINGKPKTCQTATGLTQCWSVREIKYNEQGLKTYIGHWHDYSGKIQGWHSDGNTNQIVRLKRYQRRAEVNDMPADYLYVLDMIVEQTNNHNKK